MGGLFVFRCVTSRYTEKDKEDRPGKATDVSDAMHVIAITIRGAVQRMIRNRLHCTKGQSHVQASYPICWVPRVTQSENLGMPDVAYVCGFEGIREKNMYTGGPFWTYLCSAAERVALVCFNISERWPLEIESICTA